MAMIGNPKIDVPDIEALSQIASKHKIPLVLDNTVGTPYLFLAKDFGAVCTPDIYGFNAKGILQYRGRVDSAGPKAADANTKRELKESMLEIAETGLSTQPQYPSMGCSIKWK